MQLLFLIAVVIYCSRHIVLKCNTSSLASNLLMHELAGRTGFMIRPNNSKNFPSKEFGFHDFKFFATISTTLECWGQFRHDSEKYLLIFFFANQLGQGFLTWGPWTPKGYVARFQGVHEKVSKMV